MANLIVRHIARCGPQVSVRAVSTMKFQVSEADICGLDEAQRLKHYPKLGNRDIVGSGFNGHPTYLDRATYPAPAVRWAENDAGVMALRELEKGDWKTLTMDQKKALYRSSFRQTYSEFTHPSGEWRSILAGMLWAFALTGVLTMWAKLYVYDEYPISITEEWKQAQLEKAIITRVQPIQGISSLWDYEKMTWK